MRKRHEIKLELIQALEQTEFLLLSSGNDFWANKMNCMVRKMNIHIREVDMNEIKCWYGGMGSLSDTVIINKNGRVDQIATEEFRDLIEKIFRLANEMIDPERYHEINR